MSCRDVADLIFGIFRDLSSADCLGTTTSNPKTNSCWAIVCNVLAVVIRSPPGKTRSSAVAVIADRTAYDVVRNSDRPLYSRIDVVSMNIYLFTVSTWSLLLVSVGFLSGRRVLWQTDTSYCKSEEENRKCPSRNMTVQLLTQLSTHLNTDPMSATVHSVTDGRTGRQTDRQTDRRSIMPIADHSHTAWAHWLHSIPTPGYLKGLIEVGRTYIRQLIRVTKVCLLESDSRRYNICALRKKDEQEDKNCWELQWRIQYIQYLRIILTRRTYRPIVNYHA